ncbi:MAG: galactokinase [Lachnospiraceae bacterium]|nr:galactokinase [Lachnospiraceae bacterium]
MPAHSIKHRMERQNMDPVIIDTDRLREIYGDDPKVTAYQEERIRRAFKGYHEHFGDAADLHVFSAAGRSEIGGNHTDHQRGQVLAASLNIDSLAAASAVNENKITLYSEGYKTFTVDLSSLEPDPAETGSTTALIRGVAAGFAKKGFKIGGFNAYVTSDVLGGSGLSSSASFESLIGMILSGLYNGGNISTVDIAKIGQYSENNYLGKPCGLMDQMACSVGGFVHIDFLKTGDIDEFLDDSYPKIERIDFDPAAYGYTLVITDTKASHEDLTDEYAAIPGEMKKVAGFFGKEVLTQVSEDEFIKNIPAIRDHAGDRAVVRAIHFFWENKRVADEASALKAGDFDGFLSCFAASARSSFKYLQNIHPSGSSDEQSMAVALAVSDIVLRTPLYGAARVHGGGFAGTIQAFVKTEHAESYIQAMDALLGEGSAKVYTIRKYGCVQIM